MLGTLRFALATLVVFNHVWLPTANKIGLHAVAGFFVISGYLMTLILAKTYTGFGGFLRYLLNRFLRIYPLYWVAGALTLLGLALFPQIFSNLTTAIAIPGDLDLWFRNITLINLIQSPVRLVPPAWSLTIECAYYLVLGVGIGRNRVVALAWFSISVAYTAWLLAAGVPFSQRYSTVLAGSLFFSAGSVIYHWRDEFSAIRLPRPAWWLLLIVFAASPIVADAVGGGRDYLGYYGATLLFLPIFISALHVKAAPLDIQLGNLAYPIFLFHFFALGLVRGVSRPFHLAPMSAAEAFSVYLVTVLIAVMVDRWFDPALEALRKVVRPRRGHSHAERRNEGIAPA